MQSTSYPHQVPMSDSARVLWVWRAGLAAVVGVSTGVAAHVMMGGALPGILGWLPAVVVATIVGLLLLRRRSLIGAFATALSGQWLVHELAVLGSPYSASGGHHAHHAAVAWQPTILDDAPMATGHLVAAMGTAMAILAAHNIQSAARRLQVLLGEWAHAVFSRITAPAPTLPSSGLRPSVDAPNLVQNIVLLASWGRRAPPVVSR